jgi:Lecithin:cholesterol acyltransferase
MPTTAHNQVLLRELPIVLQAQWQVQGVVQTLTSNAGGTAKPTLVVGARRRQKVHTFPKLLMTASLVELGREAGTMSNVTIDELEGLEVVFRLRNRCTAASAGAALEYKARLSDSRARFELSAAELRDVVFRPGGALGAQVNLNLLDFEVEIPAKGLDAESGNRVLVMTRRVVVFVPGLLGSTIAVDTKSPEGPVQIYPNIYRSKRRLSALQAVAEALNDPTGLIGRIGEAVAHRHIEILECDAAGQPLLASDVELFQLAGELKGVDWNQHLGPGVVYDIKDRLEAQWQARIARTQLPADFMPLTLLPWPYDWRLDLEDSAQALFKMLSTLHQTLQQDDAADDLVALSGHSTGGVIDRRVCGMPGIEQLVEHCFFMNAPFLGAPKATSVMLFGGSPPVHNEYAPMMPAPLISAAAMMRVAVNLPILYYLSPNFRYPDCVSTLSYALCRKTELMPAPDLGAHAREVEKRNAILAAVATGIYQPTRSVPASASEGERVQLALGATEWHETWWDVCRRRAYENSVGSANGDERHRARLRANPNLARQDQLRASTPVAWNETIAANAAAFHRRSESGIGASPVGLYVFWSQNSRTPGSVDIDLDGPEEELDLYHAHNPSGLRPAPEIGADFDFRFEWWPGAGRRQWVKVSGQIVDGDGTVPRASLLGIGSAKARIFKPIPGDPGHVPAPNEAWVWDRVLDVLGEQDISAHLLAGADAEPKNRPL